MTDVDGVHLFTVTFTPKVCQALSVIDGGVLRLAIHPSTRDRMLADGLLRRDPNGVLVATERTVQVIAWAKRQAS